MNFLKKFLKSNKFIVKDEINKCQFKYDEIIINNKIKIEYHLIYDDIDNYYKFFMIVLKLDNKYYCDYEKIINRYYEENKIKFKKELELYVKYKFIKNYNDLKIICY